MLDIGVREAKEGKIGMKGYYRFLHIKTFANAFLAILVLFSGTPAFASAEYVWNVAPGRSSVEFNVKHFLLMNVKGKFRKYKGKVITKDPMDFTGAQVEASIPIKSIYTGNKDRDNHLLQEEFFNAEEHPEMTFKSTSVEKIAKGKFKMTGILSIRGVDKKITFEVTHQSDKKLSNGKLCCNFKAVANLNRYDFGLRWNQATETGGIAVSEKVQIVMNISLVRPV